MNNPKRRLDNLERALVPAGAERVALILYDPATGKPLNGEPDPRAEITLWLPYNGREPLEVAHFGT